MDAIEKYFNNLIEQAGDAIFTVGKAQTILSWNDGARELLGYEAADVIGHPVDILSPLENKRHMRAMAMEVFEQGTLKNLETELTKKDGHTITAYMTVSPVADENDNVVAVSFIAKDVTDQNRLLIQLIERQRQAGQLEALVDSLTTLSHHVRNAAAVISAKAEVSRELDELKHYRLLTGVCIRETRRIVAVLETLNDMVKEVQKSGQPIETIQIAGAPGPVFDIEARLKERLNRMDKG
jgi:PAS domain S-box-containing protein